MASSKVQLYKSSTNIRHRNLVNEKESLLTQSDMITSTGRIVNVSRVTSKWVNKRVLVVQRKLTNSRSC